MELPAVQQPRVDLLCRLANGELLHIELQSANDPQMPLRMAEYALHIYRIFGRFPRQIVLYVGDAKVTMPTKLRGSRFLFHYTLIDLRELSAEPFLNSPRIADNVLAILLNVKDRKAAITQILSSIAKLEGPDRDGALAQFLILSGLRKLSADISRQVSQMPILNDIMDHEVLGPVLQKGLEQGIEQGTHQSHVTLLRRLIEKRFGLLSPATAQRLSQLSTAQLESLADRILDAPTLDSLLTP